MHRAHQSNAWIWPSRHVAEYTKLDREDFADKSLGEFQSRVQDACLAEIN